MLWCPFQIVPILGIAFDERFIEHESERWGNSKRDQTETRLHSQPYFMWHAIWTAIGEAQRGERHKDKEKGREIWPGRQTSCFVRCWLLFLHINVSHWLDNSVTMQTCVMPTDIEFLVSLFLGLISAHQRNYSNSSSFQQWSKCPVCYLHACEFARNPSIHLFEFSFSQ